VVNNGSKGGDVECGAIQWEGTLWRRRRSGRKDMGLDFSEFLSAFTAKVCGIVCFCGFSDEVGLYAKMLKQLQHIM
jgi:hypothetical protein